MSGISMLYVDNKTAEIRTFHLQLDLSLQILSRLAHDESDYGSGCTHTTIACPSTIPASRMTGICIPDQCPSFKSTVHAEHPQKHTNGSEHVQIIRGERPWHDVFRWLNGEPCVCAQKCWRWFGRIVW